MVVSFDVQTTSRSGTAGVYPEQDNGQRSNSPLACPPPRYSTLSASFLPAYPDPAELDISGAGENGLDGRPRGTGPRRSFEFSLQSDAASARPGRGSWLKLRLVGSASTMAQRPRYIGGDKVEGSVILDCEKPRLVHSVVVILRGRVVTSSLAHGSHTFVEHAHTIWTNTSGVDPCSLSATTARLIDGKPSPSTPQMVKNKLSGRFEWSFEFPFPKEFCAGEGSDSRRYTSPQTLLERGVNVTVLYEMVVKVISGNFRTKYKLPANVLYVPFLAAPPIPEERTKAYQTGSYLSNPMQDKTGWFQLDPIKVHIRPIISDEVGGAHTGVNASCTVYVAKPLTYTRGTVIPCYAVFKSEPVIHGNHQSHQEHGDNSLLKAVGDQRCLSLSLLQRMIHSTEAGSIQGSSAISNGIKISNGTNAEGTSDTTQNAGSAIWWLPNQDGSQPEGDASEAVHFLEGEIHLRSDLYPSCETPFLAVSYTVSVSVNSPTQELTLELVQSPGSPSSSPQVSPRSSKRFSRRLSAILSLTGSADGRSERTAQDSTENTSYTVVQIVTVGGEGPTPVSFMPRSARKKVDLSSVREIEYFGPVIAGFT